MANSPHAQSNYIANGLGIPAHDHIANTYDGAGNLLRVEYCMGGATGTIVGVLDMTYDGNGQLLTITRSV